MVSCLSAHWAQGFLTGKIDETTKFDETDFRNQVPRFSLEARKANMALVDVIKRVAERKGSTSAQIALAWPWRRSLPDRPDPWHDKA